jgi:hypothetical protein
MQTFFARLKHVTLMYARSNVLKLIFHLEPVSTLAPGTYMLQVLGVLPALTLII